MRRRRLAFAFTERATKNAGIYVAKYVDRWNELLLSGEKDGEGWSEGREMTEWTQALGFDIMGDLSFGMGFGVMEGMAGSAGKDGGEDGNEYRKIPELIESYVKFFYPVCLTWSKRKNRKERILFFSTMTRNPGQGAWK